MVEIPHQILCITNNHICKNQLRTILSSQCHTSILFLQSIPEVKAQLERKRFPIVLIDEQISKDNQLAFERLLSVLISLCMNSSTFILVPELRNEYFLKYIGMGFTYITDMRTIQYMLPAVLLHMQGFIYQLPLPQETYYKGLYVYPKSSTILLKQCSIKVTSTGILILLFLIKHRSYCKTECIQQYISSSVRKDITPSYVSVNIHRLSKEIKAATGLEIIKNRYGVGYYLAL